MGGPSPGPDISQTAPGPGSQQAGPSASPLRWPRKCWALILLSPRPLLFLLLLLSPLPFLSLPPSPTLLGITMASQRAETQGDTHPPLPTRHPQSPSSCLPELATPQSSQPCRPAQAGLNVPSMTFLSLSLSSCTMGRLLSRPDTRELWASVLRPRGPAQGEAGVTSAAAPFCQLLPNTCLLGRSGDHTAQWLRSGAEQ